MILCKRVSYVSEWRLNISYINILLLYPDDVGRVSAPRFLDIGSGCGVLVAAAAVLVGPGGASVGIDVKPCAITLGSDNVGRLAAMSPDYAAAAGPTSFLEHNAFVPSQDLRVPPPPLPHTQPPSSPGPLSPKKLPFQP